MNAVKIAFLFPGQGAQYPGMGRDFAQTYAVSRHVFEEVDDLLGRSLSHTIFEGPKDLLTETENSQLAIYTTSMGLLAALKQLFPELRPSICAGLSLGEYTALTAGMFVTLSHGIPLVQARAGYMQEACLQNRGTMAVVMGLDATKVEEVVRELDLTEDLWVANFNCPGQVVISGTHKGIEAGSKALTAQGAKRVLPLQVSGAFHSGLMKSAEKSLTPHLLAVPLAKSSVSLVMNVPGDFVSDEKSIRQNLIQQVTQPVRWEQGIRSMMRQGVDLFIEIGPGKTLAGMNKRIGCAMPTISIETVDDVRACEEFLERKI